MSSAVVSSVRSKQLDARSVPPEQVTDDQVKDPKRLAELLGRLLVAVTELRRAWDPKRIDFEDQAVTAGTAFGLEHRFGGRVRWWVVDWVPDATGDVAIFERTASTDTLLTLLPQNTGTVTIRVEEAG